MIADLKSSHSDICYSKYADDLTAVITAAISDFATSEFGHIQDWSSANRLHINLSKTKEMIIFRPGFGLKSHHKKSLALNKSTQSNFWESGFRTVCHLRPILMITQYPLYLSVSICSNNSRLEGWIRLPWILCSSRLSWTKLPTLPNLNSGYLPVAAR